MRNDIPPACQSASMEEEYKNRWYRSFVYWPARYLTDFNLRELAAGIDALCSSFIRMAHAASEEEEHACTAFC